MSVVTLVREGLFCEQNESNVALKLTLSANNAWLCAELLHCVEILKSKTPHTYSSTFTEMLILRLTQEMTAPGRYVSQHPLFRW